MTSRTNARKGGTRPWWEGRVTAHNVAAMAAAVRGARSMGIVTAAAAAAKDYLRRAEAELARRDRAADEAGEAAWYGYGDPRLACAAAGAYDALREAIEELRRELS